jgi:hypothetical protein
MKLSQRRVELVPKVLAVCQELIDRGERPTGVKIRKLLPGVSVETARVVRDYLVRQGDISLVQFWPEWTDEYRVAAGPAAATWDGRVDRYRYELGPGNHNWPTGRRPALERSRS